MHNSLFFRISFCGEEGYFFMLLVLFLIFFYLVIFLRVGFLTLWERYLLGSRQLRLSPNKSGFIGLLQPIFDGLKLLSKGVIYSKFSVKYYIFFMPIIIFFFFILLWRILPFYYFIIVNPHSSLFFLGIVGSLTIFLFLLSISSFRFFRILASFRFSLLGISYELPLFFLILCYILSSFCFEFNFFRMIHSFFFVLSFFVVILLEMGRTPFDFFESERELVRGYNVEFRGLLFLFIFLGEYGFILVYSFLMRSLFFFSPFYFFIILFFITYFRRVLPRLRFDLVRVFFWFKFLPLSIFLSLFVFFLYGFSINSIRSLGLFGYNSFCCSVILLMLYLLDLILFCYLYVYFLYFVELFFFWSILFLFL